MRFQKQEALLIFLRPVLRDSRNCQEIIMPLIESHLSSISSSQMKKYAYSSLRKDYSIGEYQWLKNAKRSLRTICWEMESSISKASNTLKRSPLFRMPFALTFWTKLKEVLILSKLCKCTKKKLLIISKIFSHFLLKSFFRTFSSL